MNHFTPNQSSRILLWDIDGTLVRSRRNGSFRDYFAPMLESVFGACGCLNELQVSGMTDLQIICEALREEGVTHKDVRAKLDELQKHYIAGMQRVTAENPSLFYALPGARAALEAVASNPRYASALLTGNIEPAAYLKLELTNLREFFQLPGAFGDASHDRRELPAIAAERISRHFDFDFRPSQFIVVGDTPNDIICARHFGARVVAVATGRSHPAELLRQCEPDALLPDLTDSTLFLKTLERL